MEAHASGAGVLTLAGLLRETRRRLAEGLVETPDIDARVLMEGLLGADARTMIISGDHPVPKAERLRLEEAIARRLSGEPVHRILGRRSFYGLDLALSPATLEPRPDTEILVDAVLPHVQRIAAARGRCRIADMGTGTGALCLALLSVCPQATGVGVDISREALATAQENARMNGLSDRYSTIESDWFQSVAGELDVIVSNPPYIRRGDLGTLPREVREHDPMIALDGGEDGLDAYRVLARDASARLLSGGVVGVEYGEMQRADVEAIFRGRGYRVESALRDLGGRDRVSVFMP